jgi:RNA polymerase sigma-70 factor (ECF subfamily)
MASLGQLPDAWYRDSMRSLPSHARSHESSPDDASPRVEGLGDLRELYAAHAEFVRRMVLRLCGPSRAASPALDADDLVHDVFVVALRSGDRFAGRSTARTWLCGIAVHLVARARRRERLRRMVGLDHIAEPPSDSPSPLEVFEKAESARVLYALVDKLSEKKRIVFVLYELEGLSGEEIAEAVGCPVKTVWTRLHHARKEFLRHLERSNAAQRSKP